MSNTIYPQLSLANEICLIYSLARSIWNQQEKVQSAPEARDPAEQWIYYVHYLDFNRRMDEWVTPNRIVELPSVAAKLAKEHASAKPQPHGDDSPLALVDDEDEDSVRKSRRKRKNEDDAGGGGSDDPTVVADMEHDEHEGMDEASLKEHEEVTKVKVGQS